MSSSTISETRYGRTVNGLEYHHILPNSVQDHRLIRDLKRRGLWNQESTTYNGIYLPTDPNTVSNTGISSHRTSHPAYNDWYRSQLNEIERQYGDDPRAAQSRIIALNNFLKMEFLNPETKLGLRYDDFGSPGHWQKISFREIEKWAESGKFPREFKSAMAAYRAGLLGSPLRVFSSRVDEASLENDDFLNSNSTMSRDDRIKARNQLVINLENFQRLIGALPEASRPNGDPIKQRAVSEAFWAYNSGKVPLDKAIDVVSGKVKSLAIPIAGSGIYTIITPDLASAAAGVIDGLDKGSVLVDGISLSLLGYALIESDVIPEDAGIGDILGLLRSSSVASALVGKLDNFAVEAGKEVVLSGIATMLGFGLIWKGYEIFQSIEGLDGALALAAEVGDNATIDKLAGMVASATSYVASNDAPDEFDVAINMSVLIEQQFGSAATLTIRKGIADILKANGMTVHHWRVVPLSELMEQAVLLAQVNSQISFEDIVKNAMALHLAEEDAQLLVAMIPDACFAAGTLIDMWDGSQKPIEAIEEGDLVTSYDRTGKLVAGEVRNTFVQQVAMVLDLFGTKVTPGHVTYCADGVFAGQHVPILDILRSDGALMLRNGQVIRAATGAVVGSADDQMVQAVCGAFDTQGDLHEQQRGMIRAGTRVLLPSGQDVTVASLVRAMGGRILPTGLIAYQGSELPFHWSFGASLPRPEDYVLAKSKTHLQEIYQANEWGEMAPQMPRPRHLKGQSKGPMLQ